MKSSANNELIKANGALREEARSTEKQVRQKQLAMVCAQETYAALANGYGNYFAD